MSFDDQLSRFHAGATGSRFTLVSHRAAFLRRVEQRVQLARQDVAGVAKRNLGGGGALTGSVRAIDEGFGRGRVGSDHPGAKAQELGAYITPSRRQALKFEGRYSMKARIPAKRWLSRAARQWGALLSRRLRS